jgi:uncharacterized protein (DUF2267 family)
MSTSHPSPHTRHESHAATSYRAFLDDVERQGVPADLAEVSAVAVLSVLGHRILSGAGRHLEEHLPSTLRELLVHTPQRRFGKRELLLMVADDLAVSLDAVEPIVRAVFRAVQQRLSAGEAQKIGATLPPDLAALWLYP